MPKVSKFKINKKKKLLILLGVVVLIVIIVANILVRNMIVNRNAEAENYQAGENTNTDLIAKYIRSGVKIGGVTGTLEALDTSDADATAADIVWGKTAYVNGQKITGTYIPSSNYTFTDSLDNVVKVPRRI